MVGIFVDQHMREQTRSRPATFDRAAWQRGLREAIAARAGHPWAHNAVHDESTGDVFQFFGHILAQPPQLAAALGTGCIAGGQFDLHARNVIGDRLALRFIDRCVLWQAQSGGQSGDGDLAHLQRQLQLLRCLRRWPKPMGALASQLMPQLRDQNRLRLHFGQQKCGECPQFRRVFRE